MKKCENDTWDKVFPLSEKVNHKKVSFQNQYGFTLVGDLYTPKSVSPQDGLSAERSVSETVCQQSGLPAIAVSGPFGATKEQSSGLYAMKMAPSQARVRPNRVVRLRRTSIPRTSWQRWIS